MSVDGFDSKAVSRVALLGRDFRGVNLELLVAPGDTVHAGDAVMRDLRRQRILITAPVSGTVAKVERGLRRRLSTIQFEIDPAIEPREFDPPAANPSRAYLLQTGAWAALRTRPFGNIPNPEIDPAALFITAMDAEVGAPAVDRIINCYLDEFNAGVQLLKGVFNTQLFLCHAADYLPAIESVAGVRNVAFSGGEAAGLPGVHIHALRPLGINGREVWHLGYQEVIALGYLWLHQKPWQQRILTLSGDAVVEPRNLLLPPGAAVDAVLDGETRRGARQIRMGSANFGELLRAAEPFVRAGQRQIDVQLGPVAISLEPGLTRTVIPSDRIDAVAPPGIYAVPLMRALQLGDVERARDLGAFELVEEDVALLSRVCLSGNDYGRLLRRVLDELEGMRA